jgi:ABC-type antimicrobial peptide transport system permease subunit
MVARANESQTGIEPVWADVVGVVEHIRPEELRREGRPTIYFPYRFLSYSELTLTLRTVADPLGLAAPLQREVAALDPDLPLVAVRPLEGYVGDALAPTRFTLTLIGVFAGIATLLALVGLYGVISYAVTQRSREIGVRLAFGARQSTIFRLIVGQSLRLALGGVALGLAGALALTRLLSGLLFGVTATDPLTFAALSLLLLGVGFAASFVPAVRATRVDPAATLRAE